MFTITDIINSAPRYLPVHALVEADVPRVMGPKYGCQTLPVPWAGLGSQYTLLFESFVLSWLKISTVDAVRKQLKIIGNAVVNATMFDRYLPFSCPLNTFVTDAIRFAPFHHH